MKSLVAFNVAIVIGAVTAAVMLPEKVSTPIAKAAPAPSVDTRPALGNRTAYLPPQCYATTSKTRNSCFACHQATREPNYVDDEGVQSELSVPARAQDNPWSNVVTPPAPVAPAIMNDAALATYVGTDNYRDAAGEPRVARELGCYFAPDAEGWDRAPDGTKTGWRAYAYTSLPGMFWPTNGSAGDAYIRLPAEFRRDEVGVPSDAIYARNLATVEAAVRRTDIPRSYVGAAWEQPLAPGLYPAGTELIHSLRYLEVDGERVRPGVRMKEVRYMQKRRYLTYAELDLAAKAEMKEKAEDPDLLKRIAGDAERGLATGTGWVMRGYIEAADGALRPQTLEETAACIGCHGGVGAGTDSTFSFERKRAWGSESAFAAVPEPVRADGRGEYRVYLEAVGGGDDYGANAELQAKFFDEHGALRPAMARALAQDVRVLTVPSPDRARALARGYLAIVRSQSYLRGRDAIVGRPEVQTRLEQGGSTGIEDPIGPAWRP